MNRLSEVWQQLERKGAFQEGFHRLRYAEKSACDLSLGVKTPEGYRILALRLPRSVLPLAADSRFKGIRVDKVADPAGPGHFFLNLVLTERSFADVFDVLLADMIGKLLHLSNSRDIVNTFFTRLSGWQSLFEQFSPEGLSAEQQQGLFAELYLLRKLLLSSTGCARIVRSWVGSQSAVQDFQYRDWATEVKSLGGSTHLKFTVNGERQLDESGLANLFIFCLSLEKRNQEEETLNRIVESVRELLSREAVCLPEFGQKLIEAGFFGAHHHLYEGQGYLIREEFIFKVQDNFPRIRACDLLPGVGQVKYTVDLASCLPFRITEAVFFSTVGSE